MAKENASKPRLVVSELSVSEKKAMIEKNLKMLRNSQDPDEKRNIRALLRRLGHTGGLNEGNGRKAGTPNKKKVVVKNKRARKANPTPEMAGATA